MNGKKVLFLFLALALPGCIFVFLKMFGKNEFDVPVLHQTGVIEHPSDCNFKYTAPYAIADSVIHSLKAKSQAKLYLINFGNDQAVNERLKTESKNDDIQILSANEIWTDHQNRQVIQSCVFLSPSADLVLVDNEKRIRGTYVSTKLDEVDRVLLEIKIILKKY
jgi:hypothetical protein